MEDLEVRPTLLSLFVFSICCQGLWLGVTNVWPSFTIPELLLLCVTPVCLGLAGCLGASSHMVYLSHAFLHLSVLVFIAVFIPFVRYCIHF